MTDASRLTSGDVLTTDGEAPDPADDLIDRVIGGRYRVLGIIGRGGMGVVYRAMHLELDQEVAIKVLPASYARDAETLKRFEREARTASRVRHPNVVTVFDLGRLETGEPYLVMELLDGRDLAAVMTERGTLPLADVVEILTPIAAAIDALHVEGVVHRDIKPSNIFFAKTKAMGEIVKLVDFGLAALHGGEGTERLTRVGHVVGTAVYMAPEAARGALSGPAGDTYALGVVAFELLTGLSPFDGQPMAVLMDKVSGPAPSLAGASGLEFPASVERAFASVLHRSPEKRPGTASLFVELLRAALRDSPATASGPRGEPSDASLPAAYEPPPTIDSPIVPRPSRARWAGAAVVTLLALALGGWWAFGRPPTPTPVVVAPTVNPHTPTLVIDPPPVAPPPSVATEITPTTASTTPVTAPPRPTRPTRSSTRITASGTPAVTATTSVSAPPAPATEATPTATDRTADLLRQAQSAMLHGQIASARDLYEEATQASPRDSAAWRGLGLADERLGLVPEARRAYERYLVLAPEARDAPTVRERLTRLAP